MSKFGLGKGLADLKAEMGNMPEISVLAGNDRVSVRNVSLAQIGANPDQPRKTFSDEELGELAGSIKEKGVLQPILLRAVQGRAHSYEIVAGERRFRASKLAGKAEIPAIIKTMDDNNAMEIALIENVQRENLNPLEESAAYKNLMTKCGYELSDVSNLIGKSESYIRNMLRLDNLPESVRKMVEAGDLSASHARTLAASDNAEELAQKIIQEKINVSDTEKLVKETKKVQKGRDFVKNSEILAELVKKLEKTLKTPVKLRERRGGAGDIVISFTSRIQLEEIVNNVIRDS